MDDVTRPAVSSGAVLPIRRLGPSGYAVCLGGIVARELLRFIHQKERFRDIRAFERYLAGNGTIVRKFFLHVSRKEQKKRFLERIDSPRKNWKFSSTDVQKGLEEIGYAPLPASVQSKVTTAIEALS